MTTPKPVSPLAESSTRRVHLAAVDVYSAIGDVRGLLDKIERDVGTDMSARAIDVEYAAMGLTRLAAAVAQLNAHSAILKVLGASTEGATS